MAAEKKKRISTLAKKHGVPDSFMLKLLIDKGFPVHSSASTIGKEEFSAVKKEILAEEAKLLGSKAKSGIRKTTTSPVTKPKEKVSEEKMTVTSKKVAGAKMIIRRTKKTEEEIRESEKKRLKASKLVKSEESAITKAVKKDNKTSEKTDDTKSATEKTEDKSLAKKDPVKRKVSLSGSVIDTNPIKKSAPMKATIEIDPELAARVERMKATAAANKKKRFSGRGRPGGPGYTGHFGGSTSSSNTGPGRRNGPSGTGGGTGGGARPHTPGSGGGYQGKKPFTPGGAARPSVPNPSALAAVNGAPGGKPGAPSKNTGWKGKKAKGKHSKKEKAERQKEQLEAVKQNVKSVMANLSKANKKVKYKKSESNEVSEETQILKVSDFITVGELAGLMEKMPATVIAKCMEMGMMVTINHRLDFDTISLLADEFGFEAELMDEYAIEVVSEDDKVEDQLHQKPRSPVITVMGHVDHGKTSVLDWIRKENVVAGESGGITQHIGAYEVETPHGNITFLDTPGHEAFSAMRARGSLVTDVIVLVVAADDRVMPQTVESIEHARAAKVPIVVAINKIDLENANPDKIKAQLAEHGVEIEEWGGKTSCVEISAKKGTGMDKLIELLVLESEVLELTANPEAKAKGAVVESQVDRGKGSVATVLVQNGTLKVGDCFVCGIYSGKVRAMLDERGKPKKSSPPSSACQVLGFDGTPQAGDDLIVVEDEKTARELASKRRMAARERDLRFRKNMSLENIYDKVRMGEISELNLIVKADVDGSAEAIASSLNKISNTEVKINIIRKGVGGVNESDITLASASEAIIIAFQLLPSRVIREMAELEGVEIRNYRIIYEIIEEVQGVAEGMLKPSIKEELVGEAEIKELFKIPKIGFIAGCMVTSGKVERDAMLRIYRNGNEMALATVESLKQYKDDVASVKSGMECGIGVKGFDGIKEGDTMAFFKKVEVARTFVDVERDEATAKKAVEDEAIAKEAEKKAAEETEAENKE